MKRILLEAGAGGTGGGGGGTTPPDWRASIPEELRAEPMFKDIPDIPTLAKSYVNAQRMIGTDKIPKPQEKWTETDWNAFYEHGGRPKTHDKYTFTPPKDLPAGLNLDPAKLDASKKILHEAGLSDKQANKVMQYYLDTVIGDQKAYQANQTRTQEEAMTALKQEYGDNVNTKIDVAKSVLKKFGGESLATLLETTGLGNNVEFIKMFAKIGESIMDDTARGQGDNLLLPEPSRAKREIDSLKMDKEFQTSIGNRTDPAHKANLKRWTDLHEMAYPPAK